MKRKHMKRKKMAQKAFFSGMLVMGAMVCFHGCGKDQKDGQEIQRQEEATKGEEKGEQKEEVVAVENLSDVVEKDVYRNQTALHDVSLFKDGHLYYTFGSHMAVATSGDLWNWDIIANGVTDENRLFNGLFQSKAFSWCGKNEKGSYSFWGPDIIYNSKIGKYCMYFGVLGKDDRSSICLAVADNVSGPFSFKGRVIDGGFGSKNVSRTLAGKLFGAKIKEQGYFDEDGNYNTDICPAALDPCVFYDADDRLWMVYGSGNGGIYLLELDQKTGFAIHPEAQEGTDTDIYFGRHILGYGDDSCEAPYIMYQEDSGYYYLFVSYGNIANDGGYDIREFRSKDVTGPYVDAMGQTWTGAVENHADFGVKLIGNYQLPSNAEAYVSCGHPAVVTDSDGRFLLLHHTRFGDNTGDYEMRVRQMFLNEDGWFTAAPFHINDLQKEEKLKESGYGTNKLMGTYYVIRHGNEITADIRKAETISLESDNVLNGVSGGYWEKIDDMPYANITLDDRTYQGVFLKQKDEGGHNVMVFTGVCAENNQSIWAVKYLELGKLGNEVPVADK